MGISTASGVQHRWTERLDRLFGVTAAGSSVRTELRAGLTTFITMAYILFVNPAILADAGLNPAAAQMATALSAALATLVMGLYARLPIALAPGMGLNAYFTYTVVQGMGIPWETVLGAVFIDGVLILVISVLPIRERIFRDIPMNLKIATSVAIGLFIAFIGLKNAGVVVANPATFVGLGDVNSPGVLVALLGLLLAGLFMALRVRGALIWSVLATTLIAAFVPNADGTGTLAQLPRSLADVVRAPDLGIFAQGFLQLDIRGALNMGLIAVIFTFTFVDMFDTVGTLAGLTTKMGIIDRTGSFPGAGRALIADASGAVIASLMGTSTCTSYIESAAGIAEGGRTGLTAVTTAGLFLLSVFLWPLAGVIPAQATAPVLIIVGFLMMEPIKNLRLDDVTEALPAFLTLLMMPLTFSIANGLIFGILAYVVLKLVTGRLREVSVTMWILGILFVIYLAMAGA